MAGTFHSSSRKSRASRRKALPSGSRLVIIGNGMVGTRFCEYLIEEKLNRKVEVIIIGEEEQPAYNRVNLSCFVKHRSPEKLQLRARSWYEEHGISLSTGVRVSSIARKSKKLELSDGETISYDYLVIATGSRPFIPPIPGADSPQVFPYRTIADLENIIAAAQGKKSAAIVGGGLLGLEAAQALQSLGLETSVIERANFLMPQQLNEAGSQRLLERVEQEGIKSHLGTQKTVIAHHQDHLELTLDDSERIKVDLVIISAGITPNSELAEGSGLATGVRGGIVVDDDLQTDDPHISAIGECALLGGRIYGLVAPGYVMAHHLAKRLAGYRTKSLLDLDCSTRLKMLGVEVTTIGEPLQEGRQIEHESPEGYRLLTFGKKRRLIGALGVGPWVESGQVQSTFSAGEKISPAQEESFLTTGRLYPHQEVQDPSTWPESRIVCNCVSVTKGQLVAALEANQCDPHRVCQATGASSVCGSCLPLVQQLCGSPLTGGRKRFAVPALLITSILALAVVLYSIIFPGAPVADSVQSIWYQISQLWRDNFIKQISGYSLLGIFLIGLLISLRKRFAWFTWGNFTTWRFFHAAFGLTALAALWAHTGFHFGANLNFWLMFTFVVLNLLGALAGIVTAIEARGTTPAAIKARRLRPILTWAHLIFFWPLPVLLTFHILSVYLY